MNIDLVKILDELEKKRKYRKKQLLKLLKFPCFAYKKNYAQGKDNVEISINKKVEKYKFYQKKIVVEKINKPSLEIDLEQAQQYKKGPVKIR